MAKRSLDELFNREIYDKLASRGSMTTKIACQILGLHYMTIYGRIKTGTLRATRIIDEFNFQYKLTDEDIVISFGGDLGSLERQGVGLNTLKEKQQESYLWKKAIFLT